MPHQPIRTTVMGSYPFPGWLQHASASLDAFGPADIVEAQDDATTVAIMDQVRAGLDVITDGEQSRFDFNLSFYAFLDGIEVDESTVRRFDPPAHDQRGKHRIVGELTAPRGLGVVEEFERLQRLAPPGPQLKAAIPGPYTLAGRIEPGGDHPDRYAVTEALLPIVRTELEGLIEAGCEVVTVDEPSMSCYAYREEPERLVDIYNRTVAPIVGKAWVGAHLCFGNFKARPVAPRSYAPMFPAFLELTADEIHLEMANREYAELEVIEQIAERTHVAVGVIDVKNSWVEPPEHVAAKIHECLRYVPADRLSVAPDCGLSQTARWLAQTKLANMVAGAQAVRQTLQAEPERKRWWHR
jgi:5-methyltetrahydropteroyltriglutamate--homocysteine methyltransferase